MVSLTVHLVAATDPHNAHTKGFILDASATTHGPTQARDGHPPTDDRRSKLPRHHLLDRLRLGFIEVPFLLEKVIEAGSHALLTHRSNSVWCWRASARSASVVEEEQTLTRAGPMAGCDYEQRRVGCISERLNLLTVFTQTPFNLVR